MRKSNILLYFVIRIRTGNSSDWALNRYKMHAKHGKNAFWRPHVSQNRIETRFWLHGRGCLNCYPDSIVHTHAAAIAQWYSFVRLPLCNCTFMISLLDTFSGKVPIAFLILIFPFSYICPLHRHHVTLISAIFSNNIAELFTRFETKCSQKAAHEFIIHEPPAEICRINMWHTMIKFTYCSRSPAYHYSFRTCRTQD